LTVIYIVPELVNVFSNELIKIIKISTVACFTQFSHWIYTSDFFVVPI